MSACIHGNERVCGICPTLCVESWCRNPKLPGSDLCERHAAPKCAACGCRACICKLEHAEAELAVERPTYYRAEASAFECWDYIRAHGLGFLEGNVVKYVTRWRRKGGVEDLRKAKQYLEKLIAVASKAEADETYEEMPPL